MKKINFILIQLLILIGLISNISLLQNSFFGLLLSLTYFSINSTIWKNIFNKKFGLLLIFCFFIIFGSGIYYLYQLNNFIVLLLLLIVSTISIVFYKPEHLVINFKKAVLFHLNTKIILLLSTFLLFYIYYIFILINNTITKSIASPWHELPYSIFIVYILSLLIAFLLFYLNKNKLLNRIILSSLYFQTFGIAYIIYKLGFGYDPFIHQATEQHIYSNGFILPKPLYYLGQYSLVIILAKAFQISIEIFDKFLLLFLITIYLPSFLLSTFKNLFKTRFNQYLAVCLFLTLPIPYFINSTPFGIALFFCILVILNSFNYLYSKNNKYLYLITIFSLSACAIHPIVGIPCLILLTILLSLNFNIYLRSIIYIFSSITIPAIFIFHSYISNIHLSFNSLKNLIPNFDSSIIYFKNTYFPILDTIYTYIFNYNLILFTLCMIGLYFFHKKNKEKTYFFIISIIILFLNYKITKDLIVFNNLIEYEQSDFALRIIQIIQILATPFAIYTLIKLKNKIFVQPKILPKTFIISLFIFLITTNFYSNYPRKDNFENSKGYNVSTSDFKAAEYINTTAKDSNYIVLSTQNTAAAAVKLYGFKSYYNDQFYYPIPTNCELYKIYREMINKKPTIDLINSAKQLTQVDTVYFIIPKYWFNSEGKIRDAKLLTNNFHSIDNDELYIFKF